MAFCVLPVCALKNATSIPSLPRGPVPSTGTFYRKLLSIENLLFFFSFILHLSASLFGGTGELAKIPARWNLHYFREPESSSGPSPAVSPGHDSDYYMVSSTNILSANLRF